MSDITLTEREHGVLLGISHGRTNKAIGTPRQMTEAQVKNTARTLFAKLGVGDRAHAVRRGFELGLLTPAAGNGSITTAQPEERFL